MHICTTETPFTTPEENLHNEINGVSMGSALGPIFANNYISSVENKTLPAFKNEHQITYCRYGDIFVIAANYDVFE